MAYYKTTNKKLQTLSSVVVIFYPDNTLVSRCRWEKMTTPLHNSMAFEQNCKIAHTYTQYIDITKQSFLHHAVHVHNHWQHIVSFQEFRVSLMFPSFTKLENMKLIGPMFSTIPWLAFPHLRSDLFDIQY